MHNLSFAYDELTITNLTSASHMSTYVHTYIHTRMYKHVMYEHVHLYIPWNFKCTHSCVCLSGWWLSILWYVATALRPSCVWIVPSSLRPTVWCVVFIFVLSVKIFLPFKNQNVSDVTQWCSCFVYFMTIAGTITKPLHFVYSAVLCVRVLFLLWFRCFTFLFTLFFFQCPRFSAWNFILYIYVFFYRSLALCSVFFIILVFMVHNFYLIHYCCHKCSCLFRKNIWRVT